MNKLTARELEVVQLASRGLQDKEIGSALGLSHLTVRNQLRAARAKTGCSNRTQLALWAIGRGVSPVPELHVGLFAGGAQ